MKTETAIIEPKIAVSYGRVSSTRQTTEDKTGIDRQLETARRVVKEKGWALDENLSIADLGLSGYSGANTADTAKLGILLKALKDGKLPNGRILIIEALDRLTRLDVDEAYDLFRDILRAGMEIYVARGSRHYTKDSLKSPTDLIITIVELAAGNEYSAKLGERISKAWEIKKARFSESGKPYRFKPPGWLEWNEKTESYGAIPEKVKSIKRLFELANMGLGIRGITKRMNAEEVPIIAGYDGKKIKSRTWSNVVVANLIHKKTVLGFNMNLTPPAKMYPEVIKPEVYYAAKAKVDRRRTKKYYGRRANDGANLFLGMIHCANCNNAMQYHHVKANLKYRHKNPNFGTRGGVGARGGKETHEYLWCHGYLNGSCLTKQIRSDWFEESFITAVSCSVASMNMTDCKQIKQTANAEMLKGELAEVRQTLGTYTADYEKFQSNMLAELMQKQEAKQIRLLNELENAITIDVGTTSVAEAKKNLMTLMYQDWTATDTRLEARELIRGLVDKIMIQIKNLSYVIHWKTGKTTSVELMRAGTNKLARLKGYNIDGIFYPSVGKDWNQATADIANYAKSVKE